jgi:DNA gyrase/topoisomerase IV subunit B
VTAVSDPPNGTAFVNIDGTITYTPDAEFFGQDSFTYTVEDGTGGSDTATVTVTVTPVNDGPVANDDAATTDEDTAVVVSVLANDTDVDSATLTVTAVSDPANGTGTTDGSTVTYTPDADFFGVDCFTYDVTDGSLTDTAAVCVTVDAVNDAPVANDDTASTDEDTLVTVDVLANDTDVDSAALTVTAVSDPANGSVTTDGSTITYTPDADFFGVDCFTYDVSDGSLTDTATVCVTVNAVNDAPSANDDSATTDEDTAVVVSVLDNDTDVDSASLTVTAVSDPANGTATTDGSTVTYTPDADFFGVDCFTYTASDGSLTDVATLCVTVNAVNDAPVANDDSATTDEDTPVTVDVLANDANVDSATLTVTAVSDPANGSVTTDGSTVTYTPDADFFGTDCFTYTVSDGSLPDTAEVCVTVNAVNDAPSANDDSATTDEDTAVVVSVLDNDTDVDSATLTVTAVSDPANGSATTDGSTVTYTPDANFSGTDTFTYTVSDGAGGSDTAVVTVTVIATNHGPVAADDSVTTAEDTPVTVAVKGNDSDADNDALTVTAVSNPPFGSAVINPDGTVTYTPDANFYGTDSFTYTVSDPSGATATATVTVTVTPVNDAPVANDDVAVTNEDTPVTIAVLSNDTDVDSTALTVTGVSDPAHGNAATNGTTVTYTPDPNFFGTDCFFYDVSDGSLTDTATICVTVNAVNDAPSANDDSATTDEDTAVIIAVLANDTDVDSAALTVTAVSDPPHGSVTTNGTTVTYTPDPNFFGTDCFTYTASDGSLSDVAQVCVTVAPVPDEEACGDGIDNDGDGLIDEGCEPAATGRMTGGGSIGDTTARHGFELHCDASAIPNRLEVNWGKGNKFHLETMLTASCTDNPTIGPNPPAAGFDTHSGTGAGRFNGISGATIQWTFTDAGEPGRNDFASIIIRNASGQVVLNVSGFLRNGNHQAHAN